MGFFLTQVTLALPLVAAYALFALGIVLIYRASRVLNLAHGVMAMLPAYVTYKLRHAGVPSMLALALGVVAGMALGAAVEVAFVRRLRRVSATAQTVGTVAVFGLVVAIAGKVFGTTPVRSDGFFPKHVILFGSSGLSYEQIGLIAVAIALTAGLFALFRYTSIGLAMRGAASNRTAAGIVGINPDRTTQLAWMLGGGMAAVAGIMLSGVTSLDPFRFPLQALPAYVAALIGGLGSMPGALVGSAVVGLTIGIVPGLQQIGFLKGFASSIGAPQAVLGVVAFVVMALRGEKLSAGDVRSGGLS
jgi:branched-chain amino acid transport system permease protein